jgi:IS30 family transposase
MDDNITKILDRLPPRPPRSRLDMHATLIEEMRRRGRTYKEIARVLAETCQVKSSPSNIFYFVRLRAREAKQARSRRAEQFVKEPLASSKVASTQSAVRSTAQRGNPPEDIAQRIAAVKNRKPPEPPPMGFTFDPNEPLRLIDPSKQKSDD